MTSRKRSGSDQHGLEKCVKVRSEEPAHSPTTKTFETPGLASGLLNSELAELLIQKPLSNGGGQIRLLRVLNDCDKVDRMRFSIAVHDLDDTLNFIAISYTWGDEENLQHIFIDGKKCLVRKNCHYALQQTCAKLGEAGCELIWIDSICINQQDNVEKGLQVSIMGDIYAKAAHVFACVGPHADNSELLLAKVWEVADFENAYNHELRSYAPCGTAWESWALGLDLNVLGRLYEACQIFGDRNYWTRVWIIQEVAMARSLSILCGSDMIPWRALYNLNEFLCSDPADIPSLFDKHMQTLHPLPDRIANIMRRVLMSKDAAVGKDNIFSFYFESHCSDPRDHLYGLLSLMKWPDNMTPIVPDYRISTFDLALQVLAYITFEEIPHMLALFQINSRHEAVQASVLRRRDGELSKGVKILDGPAEEFRPLYSEGRSRTCGWIRNDKHGNLTAALSSGVECDHHTYDSPGLSEASSDAASADIPSSENTDGELAINMLSFFPGASHLQPKPLMLDERVAGIVCNRAVAGDVLVPVTLPLGELYLVLRPLHGERAEIIGQAILFPRYRLGCLGAPESGHVERDLFAAQIMVKLSAHDTIVLFAQDMSTWRGVIDEESHRERVITDVTLTQAGAAMIYNQSRRSPEDD